MSVPVFILSALGLFLIIYGFLIQRLGSGTWFFAVWYLLGCGFFLLALLFGLHIWERIPRLLRMIFCGMVLLWILSVCACEAFVLHGFYASAPPQLEYLIVLGAQVREDGPSKVLKYRLDTAIAYLKDNPDTRCIVTGGKGPNEPVTEGGAMKEYMVSRGIYAERIITEEKSANTHQNFEYSKAFLPSSETKVGIVTNNFHMARARALAKKQGLKNTFGLPAPSDPFYLLNNMFREYFGVMKDFLAGNI